MLEKVKETTITKIESTAAKQANTEKANKDVGAATFEEFMARQVNHLGVGDLQDYYNSINGINIQSNADNGDIGNNTVNNDSEDSDITVTNGQASLDDIFKKAAKKYNISYQLLVAVAKAESNFNEKCVSRSGAMGVMQLMPGTAKYLGVKDAFNPEQNIMGGARYLSEKLKEQGGDVSLALAAYNAGSGAVRKYGGIPPYKETQNYVKKVNEYMKSSIDVPDKRFEVSFASSRKKTGQVAGQATNQSTTGAAGQDSVGLQAGDLSEAVVVIGEGKNGITLTYEAYKKYLELLSTGVG